MGVNPFQAVTIVSPGRGKSSSRGFRGLVDLTQRDEVVGTPHPNDSLKASLSPPVRGLSILSEETGKQTNAQSISALGSQIELQLQQQMESYQASTLDTFNFNKLSEQQKLYQEMKAPSATISKSPLGPLSGDCLSRDIASDPKASINRISA